MSDIKILSNNRVMLCGRKYCCPTMTKLPDGRYQITDDYNGKVIITKEQAELIMKGMNTLDESAETRSLLNE